MEAGALRAPAAINRISVTAPLLRLRSDEQLVALFRAGNDAAFSVIHDRYRQRLFAYARQMLGGSRQDAEDALQDVFLRAYSSLRGSDRPVSLRAWLYRVAHNRCIDHLRKPVPPPMDLFETSRKPLHDPISESERREDLRRLIEDVRRLPEQQRSALLMREIDGMSYAELADALGVSLQAVKSLLVRARIGLVEAVEARDAACAEIRSDLAGSFDRGVRASGRARRHLRDCAGCAEYRVALRGVRQGLSALAPAGPGPLAATLKLLGLGGAAGGGAAGSAAGGGVVVVAGGGTAAKVTAVVCCAALAAGGAAEVTHKLKEPSRGAGTPAAAKRSSAAPAPAISARRTGARIAPADGSASPAGAAQAASGAAVKTVAIRRSTTSPTRGVAPVAAAPAGGAADELTGGAAAPDENQGFGHGVDGLRPATELPAGGSAPPVLPAASGGTTAPADAPAPAPSAAAAAVAPKP
ncbi:MAG TPA: sigma-70 family RNA polymerase sigma factor [Solirubrobacteraceae bacterium]|nr:sigma-70 family RNA polymerase sigma factor [Solirubrobacteraceae bacterium]